MKTLMTIFTLLFTATVYAQDWDLVADIAPPESAQSDFGINMVFAGDKLVVSWPRTFTRGNAADSCGEIITYTKVNGAYQQLSRLSAADLTGSCVVGDGFGFGLAYADGKLAIGMPAGVRAGIGTSGGAADTDSRVFITTFAGDNWNLQQTLVASDLATGKGMGFQLVMQDDILLVHAHEYDTIFGFSFPVSTGVYVFKDEGTGFVEQQKLTENFHLFGQDFDYEAGQIIVGAWGEQMITQPGRIYVYENTGSSWEIVQTINDNRNANLGNQIEIFGNTMAAGNVQAGGMGAVTIYTKNTNGQWSEAQFIQASDRAFNDQFGISLKLDADELIVGATAGQDNALTLGAVYTYVKNEAGVYVEQQKLVASNPTNLYDRFGANLIFNATDLLVSSASGGFVNADVTSFHHFSRASTGGETGYSVNSKVSGTWIAEGSENQTISLEILSDGRALMFADLINNGEKLWMLGVGNVNANNIDFAHIYSTSGAKFGTQFNSSDVIVADAGQAMLDFSECNQSLLSYNFTNIASGEITLNKGLEIPGNECDNSARFLPNGISGSWYDPNRSGEGFTVYLHNQDKTQMATVSWYTYDVDGNQLAISGTGSVTNQTINITQMIKYTGFAGTNVFTGTTQQAIIGPLTMSWDNCHNATVDYDFRFGDSGDLGAGQLNLSQLTVLDNTQCDL